MPFALGLGLLLALAPAGPDPTARPRVIAHRGVAREAPENTLPAIAKAIELYLDLKEQDPRPVVRSIQQLGASSMVVYRPYSYVALQQILSDAPQARVLIDLGDWVQAPRLLETLRSDFPTGALSSDWGNWTAGAVADARRHRMPTFVNVLGASDTPETLGKAVALGFDYIQTDHPRELLAMLHAARDSPPKP